MGDVERAVAACLLAAEKGDEVAAAASAAEAARLLREAMERDSEMNVTRHMLEEVSRELDEVVRVTEFASEKPRWWTGRDHPMMVPNPSYLDLSKRYWTIGRGYRDLYTRYLKGEKEGLGKEVFKLRTDCLGMRDAVLTMLREKLRPDKEPEGK